MTEYHLCGIHNFEFSISYHRVLLGARLTYVVFAIKHCYLKKNETFSALSLVRCDLMNVPMVTRVVIIGFLVSSIG